MPIAADDTTKKLNPPSFVEVASLKDLARLACALERVALPIFGFKVNDQVLLAIQLDLFMGTPVLYFARSENVGSFLGYRNLGEKEIAELSSSTRDPANVYAPIISIQKIPDIFAEGFEAVTEKKEKGEDKREHYLSMQVEDLDSLCKVALYKIVFEESPLPLFTFKGKKGGQWILGAFARLDDSDETAVFFYTELTARPGHRFVRYSSVNPEKTGLTDRIDEHGYVYGKICELKETHPMVDL
ncbi:MAG: hypothetical protein M1503_00470 [Thaumarchaeota archaeon]|nr:hypothetical protein [Nitrososphaerota archaeon]MCL5316726.1 hypothetical protein [Nitrososphaerota archaeon]